MTEDKEIISDQTEGHPAAGREYPKRYGGTPDIFKRFSQALLVIATLVMSAPNAANAQSGAPILIVALGDSLTAGYNLPLEDAFPSKLERALKARGHKVTIHNAGVSGDTTTAALSRLDWALPAKTDGVIVELGANDALRGTSPETTRRDLGAIVASIKERGHDMLIAGMFAPPNMGQEFADQFNGIFPDLARGNNAVFYPFFLEGVAAKPELNLGDGMHPNAQGVDVIVETILPYVEELIEKIKARRKSS